MEIGIIGLGKMGFNIALNLIGKNHRVIGYDLDQESRAKFSDRGGESANSLSNLLSQLRKQKIIWLMVPAGVVVDEVINEILPDVQKGDVIIDGGNSFYKDSIRRCLKLKDKEIDFLDCGTSGGLEGALKGACLSVGGSKEAFSTCEPLFRDIAVVNGYTYTGGSGSGHFVKMVHNGIEYGMMQAIGEGYEIMENSEFELNLDDISKVWSHGSVIRSWLIELCGNIFSENPKLSNISGNVAASGEGKWCIETADELNTDVPAMKVAMAMREKSYIHPSFSSKLIAGLRHKFGGHQLNPQLPF